MSSTGHHTFTRPIRSVAIIGLGASGAPAARHLRDAGLEVTVFERQGSAGGIWNWSPETTTPLSVPTPPPSRGAFTPSIPGDLELGELKRVSRTIQGAAAEEARHRFAPPNPVYWSLTNNVPTSTMAFKDFAYPPDTPENIPHHDLAAYIRNYVAHFGLASLTQFHTRLERAVKTQDKWHLTLRQVLPSSHGVHETSYTRDFDALVVATGHYTAPYIPPLPGVAEWAAAWPQQVIHTNGYRTPEPYEGKNVLIVGIGTSGIDIARDLAPHAAHIYMVGKDPQAYAGAPDSYRAQRLFQRRLLPHNAEVVPPVRRFLPPPEEGRMEEASMELEDGREIRGISLVLFATGYQYSLPFLPHLHRDPSSSSSPQQLSEAEKRHVLITDGGSVHNLYRDVFYVADPTLAFLGLSVNTSAFNFFEYQSLSVARVFAGNARIPDHAGRVAAYEQWIGDKGEGKFSHLMGKEGERRYVAETVGWLNAERERLGLAGVVDEVMGHTDEWIRNSDYAKVATARRYGLDEGVWAEILEEIKREKERERREEGIAKTQDAEESQSKALYQYEEDRTDSSDGLARRLERELPTARPVFAS